ncbi:RNA polymerase sigma factor [Rosistilla carotiformis]|uniref:RNA polymerase sigma factor n=1 Tax=Rosistilla carotiformis TaxID=2528017 RepID=A0A518JMC8_9BACT|nr:sigma-70 family RNA polymerase sigma factor [Rosistilla carotiformis]QDV66703.1 RNA polymerase sigma factor [Rosistilla carotiformis]
MNVDVASPCEAQEALCDEQFVASIARSQVPLRAFLRTLLRCDADLDDVLQETNMVLWRKRVEYDPSRTFMSWACKIAHLQTLAYWKKHGRQRHQSLSEPMIAEIAAISAQQAEHANEKLTLLRSCLQQLNETRRRLLQSRYQKQVPVKLLAESQGRTAESLAMELFRIRVQLRGCVERKLDAEVAT